MFIKCDSSCSARATHTVVKDELLLMFCGHHLRKHGKPLADDGWYVIADSEPAAV